MPTPTWIRQAPDGSISVEGGGDLVRYDGHAWTHPGGDWPLRPGRLTWAADGTAWVVTACTWDGPVGEVLVAHYDGSAWEGAPAADGVPSCEEVLATAHGVYVGTGDGLYRLVGERWERVWPAASATKPTRDPRPLYRTMTTVVNGRVLFVGIEVSDLRIEQYQFVTEGLLAAARSGYAAARLADGRVLILGGIGALDDPLASAEIWDPTTGTVRQTGSMAAPRVAPIATLLGDGRVLVAGGAERVGDPALGSAELYDPAVGGFSPAEGALTGPLGSSDLMLDWRAGTTRMSAGARGAGCRGLRASCPAGPGMARSAVGSYGGPPTAAPRRVRVS